MNEAPPHLRTSARPDKTHSRHWAIAIAIFWSLVVAISLAWNTFLVRDNVTTQAYSQARASIDKDLAYRHLVSTIGGFYVPLKRGIAPNPYLAHLPRRDITATDGTQLTLVNSSYFVRLVHDQEALAAENGVKGHVTSAHPLRKQNMADEWELKALEKFRKGATEASDVLSVLRSAYDQLKRRV